MKNVRTTDS